MRVRKRERVRAGADTDNSRVCVEKNSREDLVISCKYEFVNFCPI